MKQSTKMNWKNNNLQIYGDIAFKIWLKITSRKSLQAIRLISCTEIHCNQVQSDGVARDSNFYIIFWLTYHQCRLLTPLNVLSIFFTWQKREQRRKMKLYIDKLKSKHMSIRYLLTSIFRFSLPVYERVILKS